MINVLFQRGDISVAFIPKGTVLYVKHNGQIGPTAAAFCTIRSARIVQFTKDTIISASDFSAVNGSAMNIHHARAPRLDAPGTPAIGFGQVNPVYRTALRWSATPTVTVDQGLGFAVSYRDEVVVHDHHHAATVSPGWDGWIVTRESLWTKVFNMMKNPNALVGSVWLRSVSISPANPTFTVERMSSYEHHHPYEDPSALEVVRVDYDIETMRVIRILDCFTRQLRQQAYFSGKPRLEIVYVGEPLPLDLVLE